MMKRAAQSLIAVAAVAMLAACGDQRPAAPPGSPDNPLVAKTETQTAREPGSPAATAKPGYQKLLKRQTARPASRFTPCNLVTRAQAQGIMGVPIRPLLEAPQGPTCIYRAQKGKDLVTVAVQQIDLKQVKGRLRQPTRLKIAKRTAICGQYGQPMLYARLASGRVLAVAASCPVAKRFASRALTRLID